MDIATVIGNVLLTVAAIVATASVVVHARVPWRDSQMGRHLMAYMGVIALVLDLGVVRLIIGDYPAFSVIRLVVFVGVPIVMAWRLVLQLQAQRADRR